ncbi:MAG: cytochrome-c peroxidase, partial [Spirochaetes bacterium]|nr:cytochrome-c peroxidase [Spirochaetota bacterium]
MLKLPYSGFYSCILFLSLCVGCKPTARDVNWQPIANAKMLEWFNKLNYQGYKGTTPYNLEFPKWFIALKVPEANLTLEAVELGRFLFYDKSLSSDSSVSCASCHRQEASFSDTRRISLGVKGRLAKRNSMPLVNLVLDRRFFWDGRAASLEAQIREPIADPNEMDLPLPELVERLKKHPLYPALFERAYGDIKITEERLTNAL